MNELNSLKSYVSEFIAENVTFQRIYNAQGIELDNINAIAQDIVNQCFVDTATWGLDYWETMLKIPTDYSKPDDYRRTVIKSKIRGFGTVSVILIQNVAESFENGDINIIENPGNYSFEVKFVGMRGIPPNLDDLKNAIEEIKPAHLGVTYTFTYTTWSEVKTIAWSQVKTGTWNDLMTRKVVTA